MEASIALLTESLALCIISIDLGLSIIYRKLIRQTRSAAMIVFCATSLGLIFFQLMDSWSALSFSPSVYSILRYIWMAIVIADGAFLLSFVPYFTTWIIAHPWRNPYKTIFFICSLVFVGVSIADLVFDSVILSRLSFLICLFVIAFCLVVMLRNRKGIEDRDVRHMILTIVIVGLSLLPFIMASFFVDYIRSITSQVIILAYSIVILVFLFISISRKLSEEKEIVDKEEEKNGSAVDLSLYHITEREEEIIELICEGNTNKEIAQKLSLSVNTVSNHITNIGTESGSLSLFRRDSRLYFHKRRNCRMM